MGIFRGHIDERISVSEKDTVGGLVKALKISSYAGIGVRVGDATLEAAEALSPGSEMHLFGYTGNLKKIRESLAPYEEDLHINYYENSYKNRDSYCWTLTNLLLDRAPLLEGQTPLFDYVRIDGLKDLTVDGLAFFLCDKLLMERGFIEFCNYTWTFMNSPSMNPHKREKTDDDYTHEMCQHAQVKLVVDALVKTDPRYKTIIKDRLYRKRPYITRRIGRG